MISQARSLKASGAILLKADQQTTWGQLAFDRGFVDKRIEMPAAEKGAALIPPQPPARGKKNPKLS